MDNKQVIDQLKEMVMDVVNDLPETIKKMDEVKEWNSIQEVIENISTIGSLVQELIVIAKFAKEKLKIDSDLDLTNENLIETITVIINEKVNLPWVPESIEHELFKFAVGMVMKTLDDLWDSIQDKLVGIKSKMVR